MFLTNCVLMLNWIVWNHHHHHVVPLARISLTLSCHFSPSFISSSRSSGLDPVSSHSCCMYVLAGRPAFSRPYVGVHRSTSHASPTMSCMSGWSNLDSFCDGRQVAVWLIWNRTDFLYKNGFGIRYIQSLICHKIQATKIGQNTEKSPGDSRRFAVAQTSV